MKNKINFFPVYFCFLILTFGFFLPKGVFAEMQSTNFQIKSDVIGSFGADSSSTNFQINDTGGEAGAEITSGSGQDLWGGFWNNLTGEAIADADDDGIADELDNCPNDANSNQSDSDNDNVGNACDNCQSDSNSNQNDSDNDDVGNVCDNCLDDDNTNQNDSDNDDVGNVCDNCPNNSNASQSDADDDGVGNVCDNCATVSNSNQADADNDGIGDACEPPIINDIDNDGILNDADNCSLTYNPNQEDMDNDGAGDACDADIDGDSVANISDNCPLSSNSSQTDMDADGTGDACDSDLDGDGISNASDNCPSVANYDQNDLDSDGIGDECDFDLDGDGASNTVDNCTVVFNPDQNDADNDNIGDACDSGLDSDGDGIENDIDNCPLAANPNQNDLDRDGFGDECDSSNNIPSVISPIEKLAEREEEKKTAIEEITSVVADIQQIGIEIEKKAQEKQNTILAANAAAAAVSMLPALANVNTLKDLSLVVMNSFGSLFGLIFRRRRDWGIVYDVDTGKPISLASVEIINNLGRSLDKKISDPIGAYVFLVPQGKYSLMIEKEGYFLAGKDDQFKTLYSDNYYGGELNIQNADMISFNIPMRSINPNNAVDGGKSLIRRGFIYRTIFFLAGLVFYIGFGIAVGSLFILPNKEMAILVMIAYMLGAILRDIASRKKGWGEIVGEAGTLSPFATVRAFEKNSGKFVARTISDEQGRYSLILRKGEYKLSVTSVKGESWEGEVKINRTKAIKQKIKLEKNNSSEPA